KWLQDLRDAQLPSGAYPSIAPTVPGVFDGGTDNTGWSDAGVNVAWQLWKAYDDTALLAEHYASMKAFVDFTITTSNGNLRNGGSYNDWLNLDDNTPSNLLGTAFYAKSARQLSEIAAELGHTA